MSRLTGIFIIVLILYLTLVGSFETARSAANHLDLARRLGFYGVLTLGVGVVIISGGIDLSIGSLVGLSAVTFGALVQSRWPAWLAALIVISAAPIVGLFHGLLITKLKLQPFLVTLCGLFIYRGIARSLSPTTVGLRIDPTLPNAESLQRQADALAGLLVNGQPLGVPNILIVLIILAVIFGILLHATVYGRHLFAVGANEQAARYAGINTDRVKIIAYVLCSTLVGLAGVLYLCEYSTATPANAGSLLELYAITGAVLGGCALRGGEGLVPGILLGAAVLPLLNKLCNFTRWIGSDGEYIVIGSALLVGTIVNQVIRRNESS